MEPQSDNPKQPNESVYDGSNADVDFLLQIEVEEANFCTTPWMGVTLLIHGLVISGTLISGDSYFDKIADDIKGDSDDAEDTRKFYRSFGDAYRQDRNATSEERKSSPKPQFIHLEDATIVSASNMTNLKVLWRGRISSVDGWFRGVPMKAQ